MYTIMDILLANSSEQINYLYTLCPLFSIYSNIILTIVKKEKQSKLILYFAQHAENLILDYRIRALGTQVEILDDNSVLLPIYKYSLKRTIHICDITEIEIATLLLASIS